MKWINAHEQMPVKFGRWFVKVNGRKEVYTHEEILRKLPFCNGLFWLDETITENSKTAKPKNGIVEDHLHNLENLMGIRKAKRILEKLKQL